MQSALKLRGLVKYFGAVKALDGVDISVRAGEVHALLGQNGSGKSTLVKVLTGVHTPDAGEASIYGATLAMPVRSPHDHGIAVIHQDIGLIDSMTTLENLGANASYGTRLLGVVSTRKEVATYRDIMDSIDFEIPLDALVSELSPAERAMLGIIRAMRLMRGRTAQQLFILDEPTAALSRIEADRVLGLMRRVADAGSAVVFISHRLNEVMDSCDRLTIMRDGKNVFSAPVATVDRSQIVQHMLGRRMEEFFPAPPDEVDRAARLVTSGLCGDVVSELNLTVRGGEILGVTGLSGMGQEELPALLAGSKPIRSGTVQVDGVVLRLRGPKDAMAAGIGLVPGNRLRDGCWAGASARENVTRPILRRFLGPAGLSRRKEAAAARASLQNVGLRPLDPERPVAQFSGGNQQKVVFATWLQLLPGILLLDEPTQGVDAGAAKDLLDQVVASAETGTAVVIFSGDHEQLVEVCHRVVVLVEGRVVADIPRERLSEGTLLTACSIDADIGQRFHGAEQSDSDISASESVV